MAGLVRTRSGELENTVYALLEPDGRTQIGRTGRGPHDVYRVRNADLQVRLAAEAMRRAAKKFPGKAPVRGLPFMADLRRALNVAACDLLPVVVVVGTHEEWRDGIAALVWDAPRRGRFVLAHVASREKLGKVAGVAKGARLLVVAPDVFGMKGTVLAQTEQTDAKALAAACDAGLSKFRPEAKDSRAHIRAGRDQGVRWKSEIPVTDPGGRRGGPPRDR